MDIRPWKEIQEVLPPLSTIEKERLKRSIELEGIRDAIKVLPDGRIIDGHHRWELSGSKDVPYVILDMLEHRAFELALSLNRDRRQMSNEQLKEVRRKWAEHRKKLQELARQLRQEEGLTQAETAERLGIAQQTISDWENEVIHITDDENAGNMYHPDLRFKITKEDRYAIHDRHTDGESQRQIAADYHVSQPTVLRAVRTVERALKKQQEREANASSGDSHIELYHNDTFLVIPSLTDNSIALVATDPPYNVTENDWDRIGTDEQYILFTHRWLEAIRPKLTENYHLFLFCSPQYQAQIELLLVGNDWPLQSRIIWWHRNMSKGRDVADKFISTWDMLFHCGTHSLNWDPKWNEERFDVQSFAAPQSNFDEGKHHPTAKPVGLIEHIVNLGSRPGDIVLDPFAGGGTTGQACANIGQRRCILVEKKDEFCAVIEKRLDIERIKGD